MFVACYTLRNLLIKLSLCFLKTVIYWHMCCAAMMYCLCTGLEALWLQKDDVLISADKQGTVIVQSLRNVHPAEDQ